MTQATVVSIHREKYDVYIGRAGRGEDGYFGNPFRVGKDGNRAEAIQKFRTYFDARIVNDLEYKRRVLDLRGKRLGCFCKPQPCHGDVIAEWLESKSQGEEHDHK